MKLLAVGIVLLAVCLLLIRWKPPAASLKRVFRDYGILASGSILFILVLHRFMVAVGMGEYAAGSSLTYVVVGLGYALGAATKAPIFWSVHSNWFLWSFLPERRQQELGVVLGLVIFAGGMAGSAQERTAYRICKNWYSVARTSAESAQVASAAPDSDLRRSRRRFETSDPPPMTCRELLR